MNHVDHVASQNYSAARAEYNRTTRRARRAGFRVAGSALAAYVLLAGGFGSVVPVAIVVLAAIVVAGTAVAVNVCVLVESLHRAHILSAKVDRLHSSLERSAMYGTFTGASSR